MKRHLPDFIKATLLILLGVLILDGIPKIDIQGLNVAYVLIVTGLVIATLPFAKRIAFKTW